MPHVAFVPLAGFRVREAAMRELGMTLAGLRQRARAIGELPSLALLTLAGMTPEPWACSLHESAGEEGALLDLLARERPDLVAISALTASVEEAYRLSGALRRAGLRTVLGGLHATACPDEARLHFDVVVAGEGEPVWAMNYYGYIARPELIDGARAGATIKAALSAMYNEGRFLGGWEWAGVHGVYRDRSVGDVAHFSGRETIAVGGVEAYALDYHGGLIKP